MRIPAFALLLVFLTLAGCSTLKGWFTPQGQKVSQAREQAKAGHDWSASVLAAEALEIEPGYRDAEEVVRQTFAPGQEEFRLAESRWLRSADTQRWDQLFALYKGQSTLGRVLPALGSGDLKVADVSEALSEAGRNAATSHFDTARSLLASSPGPRQARAAVAEGRTAAAFDARTPGLSAWLVEATRAATQKLLVIPFFSDASGPWGGLSVPLGSRISRLLTEEAGLPELTEVFSSDRLVSLPGAGLARAGLISQPDALKLAADNDQNVVLLGQITRVVWQEPRKTTTTAVRERRIVVTDPEHPAGVERLYNAKVTTTVVTTSFQLSASFAVVEVATGRDLLSAARDAESADKTVITSYTGDKEALTNEDLAAVVRLPVLAERDTLRDRALHTLAAQVADGVRAALR